MHLDVNRATAISCSDYILVTDINMLQILNFQLHFNIDTFRPCAPYTWDW